MMMRPPVHHSLTVFHQEIFPAFQSDLFPIGLGRRRVALFRIFDCNIFLTMSSWHLLRLTSLMKFAHVEVNNLDIRVSGSSRLIFRKVRFDCYFACTWFKLVYKYNYFAVNVKFWRRSSYMRVPRLHFLCFLMTMSSISALMVRFAFSTAAPMISCCHSKAKLWHQPLSHLRVQRRK